MIRKTCRDCHIEKPANEFYLNPRMKLGLSVYCKECTKKRNKKSYHNLPEWRKEQIRKYKSAHNTGMENYIIKRIEQRKKKIAKLLLEISSLKSQLGHKE